MFNNQRKLIKSSGALRLWMTSHENKEFTRVLRRRWREEARGHCADEKKYTNGVQNYFASKVNVASLAAYCNSKFKSSPWWQLHTIPLSGTQIVRMMQVLSISAGYEFASRKLILSPRRYTVCSARTKRVKKAGYPGLLAERKSSNLGLTSDEWTSTTFIL